MFKAWFVDFEPFGGVMPDDWIECILDSMCSLIIKGITPKYNEHSAQLVINQKCVRNHQIDLSLARCHEPKKVNEKWLQYGDIVVNSTGTGTLGRAAQVLFYSEQYDCRFSCYHHSCFKTRVYLLSRLMGDFS